MERVALGSNRDIFFYRRYTDSLARTSIVVVKPLSRIPLTAFEDGWGLLFLIGSNKRKLAFSGVTNRGRQSWLQKDFKK